MSKLKLFITIFLSVGIAACAHTGQVVESRVAVESVSGMANQLTLAQTQIDQVVAALNDISSTSDLPTSFKVYNKSVTNVQAGYLRAKAQRAHMRANNQRYIAKWQMELDTLQDPGIKSALGKRKEKVTSSFEHVGTLLDELNEDYKPFLTSIAEIQKALALDLNASGVKSLGGSMKEAKDQAETVKQKLHDVKEELDRITVSMSPTADTK